MKRNALAVFLISSVFAAGVAQAAAAAVETVSPGGIDRMTLVRGTTPTFSWGAASGAQSYEVMVYELSENGQESKEASLRVILPGTASSWTPDARQGLEAGKRYVWFVRAAGRGKTGDWSPGRMFSVSGAPSLAEVEAAMDVLQRYAAGDEGGGDFSAAASTELIETGAPGDALTTLSALPVVVSDDAEDAGSGGAAIGRDAIAPPAPLPFAQLGFSSSVESDLAESSVAVRGEWVSTGNTDHLVGYLGVEVGNTNSGEFDGFPHLRGLNQDEIGVLGTSTNSSSDNYGVVGVGLSSAKGGRFYNADAAGAVSNEVLLGTVTHSLVANGPIVWNCPSDMDRVGTWCVDKSVNSAADGGPSIAQCHNERKALCPLQAIITCDQMNTRKATAGSCGERTDTGGAILRTFALDTDPTLGGSAFDKFVNYHGTDNSLSTSLNSTDRQYFCCKPVSN